MSAEVKSDFVAEDAALDAGSENNGVDNHGAMADDRAAMFRMGKVQEMKRNFRFITIFGFTMVLVCTWEAIFSVASEALENGGTAGFIWMFLVAWIGFIFINVSMAEMASMAPTSGGQYHWVSEFAPRKYQKFLSYAMGWLCVLGWQADAAAVAYLGGTQIQGLIALNYPSYSSQGWHGTLLTIAVALFSIAFNTVLAKKLPLIEAIILVIHVFAFFEFSDGGGWGSIGGSTLIGIASCMLPQLGADAAVHMSEEVRDAGTTIPRCMVWSTIYNGLTGWIMVITFCFVLGNLQDDLNSNTGFPFLQVFYNVTGTVGGATAMAVFVIIIFIFAYLTVVATASRQLYAFARDNAVPGNKWLSKIDGRFKVPLNAIIFTCTTTSLISLINIGSPTALNSITSLATSGLLTGYICSIGCMVWRRVAKQPLLPAKFSLGKWGLPVNVISIVFLAFFIILSFFPQTPNPDPASMNWSILIYGAVIIFSLVYYVLHGRHNYVGPVAYVRKLA